MAGKNFFLNSSMGGSLTARAVGSQAPWQAVTVVSIVIGCANCDGFNADGATAGSACDGCSAHNRGKGPLGGSFAQRDRKR